MALVTPGGLVPSASLMYSCMAHNKLLFKLTYVAIVSDTVLLLN